MFGWGDDRRESEDQHCRELPRFVARSRLSQAAEAAHDHLRPKHAGAVVLLAPQFAPARACGAFC